jgi:hypothetical protein
MGNTRCLLLFINKPRGARCAVLIYVVHCQSHVPPPWLPCTAFPTPIQPSPSVQNEPEPEPEGVEGGYAAYAITAEYRTQER